MQRKQLKPLNAGWRSSLYEVIFEADSPAGKAFDVGLLILIILSILAVMMESVAEIRQTYGGWLRSIEWFLTVAFTVEYLLRIVCVRRPPRYIFSFYGVVDLLAILPTYLSLMFPQTHFLLVIRGLRLLRVFRVFKLARYLGEASVLMTALRASRQKIVVFLTFVLTVVMIVGAMMYLIEGSDAGFTSIPRSMYWAIVTLTTVGYGDIAPQTPLGQTLAALLMILGYGVIAVPTGIMTVELSEAQRGVARSTGFVPSSAQQCPSCEAVDHPLDADFCYHCGASLEEMS